ncbi:Chaperone protein, partial [Phytophthora palmivora]
SFASKLYNVPQDEIRLDESPKAVVHPALLLYFDSFDGTHHIASDALAARYPSDVSLQPKEANMAVATPSIIQLQSADEENLLTYLRCDDSTIIQFAMASLEGMWLGECGQSAQDEVQRALEFVGQKKWDEACEMLKQVVQDFPEYAYAWNKLAMVEYQIGNFGIALGHYETAIKLKPQLVEALVGLGTCATRLQRWSIAHRAAIQLLEVQPSNDTARMLIEQAVYATL